MNMIWIVVPLFGRHQEMDAFLADLSAQTYQEYHVVVVNHGHQEYAPAQDGDRVAIVRESPELWWTGAINRGIEAVLRSPQGAGVVGEDDFILLHNHDSHIGPGYLQALVDVATRHPQAVVGSVCVSAKSGGRQILYANVRLVRDRYQLQYDYKRRTIDELDPDVPLSGDFLKGRGTLYRVTMVRKLGPLAEKHLPHYGADHEYSYRAKKAGYEVLTAPGAVVATDFDSRHQREDCQTLADLLAYYFSRRSTESFPVTFWGAYLSFGPRYGVRYFLANSGWKFKDLLRTGVVLVLRGPWT
jgi:GT2 family glycosyltransferase